MRQSRKVEMLFQNEIEKILTRRTFLTRTTASLGLFALGSLLNDDVLADTSIVRPNGSGGILKTLHFPARAKRVIYLFQSGAPSQMDLFDYKPKLNELTGKELPKSVRGDQRITGMTSGQAKLLLVGPAYDFKRYGNCGTEMSEMLPHIGGIADDICLIRGMHTDPINHDPAVT